VAVLDHFRLIWDVTSK